MPTPTDSPVRADSYLICATPRTGSSLLCGLLESTGVAGHPESYFRQPLQQAFGNTRYVYLRRDDVVAQAVSWLRAEQTDVWFEGIQEVRRQPEREPSYDLDHIHGLVRLIGEHNAAWQEWFTSSRICPYLVVYEELEADPVGVTRGVLDFLGLEPPADREIVARHRRLADKLNTQWIERYGAKAQARTAGLTAGGVGSLGR